MSEWVAAPLAQGTMTREDAGEGPHTQRPVAPPRAIDPAQIAPASSWDSSEPARTAIPDWLRDEYTIETPENVSFGYEVAGIGSRLIGAIVDIVIVGFLLVLLNLLLFALLSWMDAADVLFFGLEGDVGWGPGLVIALYAILQFGVIWGYFISFELMLNGQTPGKRRAHTRVVRLDGNPAGFLEVTVRNLVRIIDFLPAFYAIGFVTMASNTRARRLGDFAAGTLVVREEREVTLESLLALDVKPVAPSRAAQRRAAPPATAALAAAQPVAAPAIGVPAFDGTLRRLTRDDVALAHDALRRDAEGSAPP
ncbi:MAG: RDD family protein, partial [Caldilineaceae bacterium]